MNLIISTLKKDDLYNKKIIEYTQKNLNHVEIIYAEDMPRMKEKSNTDKILDGFKKGYESCGNTTETLYLYNRNEWKIIRKNSMKMIIFYLLYRYM